MRVSNTTYAYAEREGKSERARETEQGRESESLRYHTQTHTHTHTYIHTHIHTHAHIHIPEHARIQRKSSSEREQGYNSMIPHADYYTRSFMDAHADYCTHSFIDPSIHAHTHAHVHTHDIHPRRTYQTTLFGSTKVARTSTRAWHTHRTHTHTRSPSSAARMALMSRARPPSFSNMVPCLRGACTTFCHCLFKNPTCMQDA